MFKFYCLYLFTVYGLSAVPAQNGPAGGCVLPAYPQHGTYIVDNKPEATPGQAYDSVFLTVTCDPGYGVVGPNVTYCFSSNNWLQRMPQCTRLCRLTPHSSVDYFCRVTGEGIVSGTRLCHEFEPTGTVVEPKCKTPVYYDSGFLRNMRCDDGSWDHVAICPPDCGTQTPNGNVLIRNGTRTKHGEFPWHAGIYDKSYTPVFKQVCGGSLVSPTVVISAAHCFWTDALGKLPPSRYAVALGKIYRPWNNPMDIGVQKSDVGEIKIPVHFRGENGNLQADIALVILVTPVVYTVYIRPVCMDLNIEFDRSQLQSSNSGKVSGWGLTAADGRESPVLLTAELPYVDVQSCVDELPNSFSAYITTDKICAGYKNGTAVCEGDSGGGLVFPYMDRGRRRYYLRGVVSAAPTSTGHTCDANTYTAFTHIVTHATFIKDHGVGGVSVNNGPVGRCVLPGYPQHGTYTVYNRPNAKPGQVYEAAFLTITCDPGYAVVGNSYALCSDDNKWSESIPQCSRFCKLIPHPSVNYSCRVTGDNLPMGTRSCNEFEPSGTVVIPECKHPNYYYSGVLSNMYCIKGSWNYVATCLPECGTNTGQLATNSTHASHGEMPWHAGIYEKDSTLYKQICGGSLVSSTVVISAAHCFWREIFLDPSGYAVALGKIYRTWGESADPGEQRSDVSSIKVPDRFVGAQANFQDDIALVKLSTPMVYTTYVRPICVDFDIDFDRNQLQITNPGRVVGWGLESEDGGFSQVLKSIEVQYVDAARCIQQLPEDFIRYFTSDKSCANPVKGIICKGDTGGGLAFPTEDRGTLRYYLRGVVSTAPRNEHECNVKTYFLFTRLLKHDTFIREFLNNNPVTQT